MAQGNVTGFIAEFFDKGRMNRKLKELKIEPPKEWVSEQDNFIVVSDWGRELEIAFFDFDEDKQKGEPFVVDYDDVHCWA